MGEVLIIDLDDDVVDRLRARATRNRRSLADEVVVILTDLVRGDLSAPEGC